MLNKPVLSPKSRVLFDDAFEIVPQIKEMNYHPNPITKITKVYLTKPELSPNLIERLPLAFYSPFRFQVVNNKWSVIVT